MKLKEHRSCDPNCKNMCSLLLLLFIHCFAICECAETGGGIFRSALRRSSFPNKLTIDPNPSDQTSKIPESSFNFNPLYNKGAPESDVHPQIPDTNAPDSGSRTLFAFPESHSLYPGRVVRMKLSPGSMQRMNRHRRSVSLVPDHSSSFHSVFSERFSGQALFGPQGILPQEPASSQPLTLFRKRLNQLCVAKDPMLAHVSLQSVGQGGVGNVYSGIIRDDALDMLKNFNRKYANSVESTKLASGRTVAIKVIRFDRLHGQLALDQIVREIEIAMLLQRKMGEMPPKTGSASIPKYFGCFIGKDSVGLDFEFIAGEQLFTFRPKIPQEQERSLKTSSPQAHYRRRSLLNVPSTNNPFNEFIAESVVQQLLEALSFVHSIGIVHNDIKPYNILVDRAWSVKLLDFGISDYFSMINATPRGHLHFCAPEVCTLHYTDSGLLHSQSSQSPLPGSQYQSPFHEFESKASHLSDIYSLGLTIHLVLTGISLVGERYVEVKGMVNDFDSLPFCERMLLLHDGIDLSRRVVRTMPLKIHEIVSRCLSPVHVRPSADELLQDYFRNTDPSAKKPHKRSSFSMSTGILSRISGWAQG